MDIKKLNFFAFLFQFQFDNDSAKIRMDPMTELDHESDSLMPNNNKNIFKMSTKDTCHKETCFKAITTTTTKATCNNHTGNGSSSMISVASGRDRPASSTPPISEMTRHPSFRHVIRKEKCCHHCIDHCHSLRSNRSTDGVTGVTSKKRRRATIAFTRNFEQVPIK